MVRFDGENDGAAHSGSSANSVGRGCRTGEFLHRIWLPLYYVFRGIAIEEPIKRPELCELRAALLNGCLLDPAGGRNPAVFTGFANMLQNVGRIPRKIPVGCR